MNISIKIIPIFAFILFIGSISLAEAGAPLTPAVDIVIVIDESGSMSGEHAFIKELVPDL